MLLLCPALAEKKSQGLNKGLYLTQGTSLKREQGEIRLILQNDAQERERGEINL